MSVLGIGVDAVKIERFQRVIEQRGMNFLKRIFTEKELAHANGKTTPAPAHMAGKFAAKEAVKKALPEGARIGLNWPEIEILNDSDGKPYVVLHGEAERLKKKYGLSRVFISISHTKDLAISSAVGVKDGA